MLPCRQMLKWKAFSHFLLQPRERNHLQCMNLPHSTIPVHQNQQNIAHLTTFRSHSFFSLPMPQSLPDEENLYSSVDLCLLTSNDCHSPMTIKTCSSIQCGLGIEAIQNLFVHYFSYGDTMDIRALDNIPRMGGFMVRGGILSTNAEMVNRYIHLLTLEWFSVKLSSSDFLLQPREHSHLQRMNLPHSTVPVHQFSEPAVSQ